MPAPARWLAAVVLYTAFLSFVLLQPAVGQPNGSWVREALHNLMHVPAYGFLAYLVFGLLQAGTYRGNIYALVFGLVFLYGAAMEFLQGFVPGRSPSRLDLGLNTLGISFVLWFRQRNG